MDASLMKASALRLRFSLSLASRRQRLSQAMVRSTTQRLGWTTALHPIGSLDDLGLEIGQDAGQGAVKDRPLIGAVGEQFPEKGKQTEQGRQQRETAVAILNVGGGDDAVQQQALRIDQNMPLLALDQLAGIEAVAVDASPPFSALFTLCVDDAGRGAGFARGFLAALEVERMMDAIQRAVPVPQAEVIMHGASGRQILGQARHWQPVLRSSVRILGRMYITPLITSRIATRRLPPPGLPGGISGSICAHSASVRSLG